MNYETPLLFFLSLSQLRDLFLSEMRRRLKGFDINEMLKVPAIYLKNFSPNGILTNFLVLKRFGSIIAK
jgi:hypothetical protein